MLKAFLKLQKENLVGHGVKKHIFFTETLEKASERASEPLLYSIKDSKGIKEAMNASSLE